MDKASCQDQPRTPDLPEPEPEPGRGEAGRGEGKGKAAKKVTGGVVRPSKEGRVSQGS